MTSFRLESLNNIIASSRDVFIYIYISNNVVIGLDKRLGNVIIVRRHVCLVVNIAFGVNRRQQSPQFDGRVCTVFDYVLPETCRRRPRRVNGVVSEWSRGAGGMAKGPGEDERQVTGKAPLWRGESVREMDQNTWWAMRCSVHVPFVIPDLLSHKGLEPFNFDRVCWG